MNKKKYSIGEISKITGLTIKALRYYDAKNILSPVFIDPYTKYRYYSDEQIAKLNLIKDLKMTGLPLAEIKYFLNHASLTEIIEVLEMHKQRLYGEIENLQQTKNALEDRIHIYKQAAELSFEQYAAKPILLEEIKDQHIIFIREKCVCKPATFLKHYNELVKMVNKYQLRMTGYASAIFYDDYREFDFNNADIEMFFPVLQSKPHYDFIRVLPGQLYASIIHKGNYTNTPESYGLLLDWIESNNAEIVGASMETYLIDFSLMSDQSEYITKLSIPVAFKK